MKTFGTRWRARYERLRASYARSLESDPRQGRANARDPEWRVSVELAQGVQVLLGGDEAAARRCFERGMESRLSETAAPDRSLRPATRAGEHRRRASTK